MTNAAAKAKTTKAAAAANRHILYADPELVHDLRVIALSGKTTLQALTDTILRAWRDTHHAERERQILELMPEVRTKAEPDKHTPAQVARIKTKLAKLAKGKKKLARVPPASSTAISSPPTDEPGPPNVPKGSPF